MQITYKHFVERCIIYVVSKKKYVLTKCNNKKNSNILISVINNYINRHF